MRETTIMAAISTISGSSPLMNRMDPRTAVVAIPNLSSSCAEATNKAQMYSYLNSALSTPSSSLPRRSI